MPEGKVYKIDPIGSFGFEVIHESLSVSLIGIVTKKKGTIEVYKPLVMVKKPKSSDFKLSPPVLGEDKKIQLIGGGFVLTPLEVDPQHHEAEFDLLFEAYEESEEKK